ncbi:MAG: hypothetical protein WDA47_03010 [Bacilli bacterium]
MSCIMNMNRLIIPNDIITKLTMIYTYIGRSEIFENTVGNDLDRIVSQTVERDAYFFAKITNIELTDARMRLIITKDSEPRNKDEATLYGVKELLKSFHVNKNSFGTQSNDLINLVNYIHPNQNIKYDYDEAEHKSILQSQGMKSKRIIVDEINDEVNLITRKKDLEKIVLNIHYFIDIYNLKPFSLKNEEVSYLLLYLLLLKCNISSMKYASLFEFIYNDFDRFESELKNASYNWKEGYSQSLGFVRLMMELIIKTFERTEDIIKEYKFDSSLNKSDNVENTIIKLPEIFTKEDIRLEHPYVSESTINRTLSKLRQEKIIKPLAKGRSAKWIKIKG